MLGFFFGLEEDKITWHSNSRAWLVTYAGLEEDEITWFSNSKRFSECCTVGLADVKLHGAQTGFLRCADEFPAWKGELHGTQTHRNIQETTNLVWKKVKLHGTQTRKNVPNAALWFWQT